MKEKEEKKELEPNEIVRKRDGAKYFGLKHTQIDEAIDKGLIPAPFQLYEGGRATGWTGAMILEHQRKRIAAKNTNPKQYAAKKGEVK